MEKPNYPRYEKAIKFLVHNNLFKTDNVYFHIAKLFAYEDWIAIYDCPWWTSKRAYVIGFDWEGNFIVFKGGGEVYYRNHSEDRLVLLSRSVETFASLIK